MLGRLWHHQWSFNDAITVAGVVVVAVVVAVFGPTRPWLVRLLRAGRPERRYATWFIQKWGQYENPYLDDVESLDLSNTFVSLSFSAQDTGQETRTVATAVLANRRAGNLVIEGAPGSGKSTLLKAYGVGTLRLRGRVRRKRRPGGDIPFFVQVRKLSRWLDQRAGDGLVSYLVEEVLISGAGMARTDATDFLHYALTEDRALVLLDGLDEVAADRHEAVLEAVDKFRTDRNQALPTHQARLVVTCRRPNFPAIRDRWVPVIARTVAPLRNSEIFSYLDKLRGKFKTRPDRRTSSRRSGRPAPWTCIGVPLVLGGGVEDRDLAPLRVRGPGQQSGRAVRRSRSSSATRCSWMDRCANTNWPASEASVSSPDRSTISATNSGGCWTASRRGRAPWRTR